MTYNDLLSELFDLTTEQLQQEAVIHLPLSDNYYPVELLSVILKAPGTKLNHGQVILTIGEKERK